MLHVAIVSLAVLCAVCVTVCVIMVALFFILCKRRSNRVCQHYDKVPLTDRDIEVDEAKLLILNYFYNVMTLCYGFFWCEL